MVQQALKNLAVDELFNAFTAFKDQCLKPKHSYLRNGWEVQMGPWSRHTLALSEWNRITGGLSPSLSQPPPQFVCFVHLICVVSLCASSLLSFPRVLWSSGWSREVWDRKVTWLWLPHLGWSLGSWHCAGGGTISAG